MTKMATMPIHGKTEKKRFRLQNRQVDDLENLFVALCKQVLPKLFKL